MAFEGFPPYLPLTTLENAHSLYFALPWLKLGVGIIDRASIPAIANAFFNNLNSTYTFIARKKRRQLPLILDRLSIIKNIVCRIFHLP